MKNIFVFGEVLWDVFPDSRVIGGAPFNFSAHLASLGANSYLISAVGNDILGSETLNCIAEKNVDASFVKTIEKPTGVCRVTLDESGTPSYNLVGDVAYDNIFLSRDDIAGIEAFSEKCLYMGSLALRNSVSYETLKTLVKSCCWDEVFFDINIRQNYYCAEVADFCLKACSVLKFSREEAYVFKKLGLSPYDETDAKVLCADLADRYGINIVILTLDKDGAAVYLSNTDTFVYSQKPSCTVVSTVGAGDSFFAAYISAYLNNCSVEKCLADAVAVSSFVVEHMEAIPEYSKELIEKIK